MRLRLLLLGGAMLAAPALADGNSTAITLTGNVDKACHIGSPSTLSVSLGNLANASDGTLLTSIPLSDTTISDSWCNTGSTIGVLATPLVALGYSGAPPSGFTKAVNYTAAASGWSPTAASFTTNAIADGSGSGSTPATQSAGNPVAQTITVSLSSFHSPSSGLRLVADTNYSGTITITLTVGS